MIRFKSQSGFTLTEVMISLLLLAIILVGGIKLFTYSQMIMVQAMHKKIATEVANDFMEEVKGEKLDQIKSRFPKNDVHVGDLVLKYSLVDNTQLAELEGQSPNFVGYDQVNLKVSWNESDKKDDQYLIISMPVNL